MLAADGCLAAAVMSLSLRTGAAGPGAAGASGGFGGAAMNDTWNDSPEMNFDGIFRASLIMGALVVGGFLLCFLIGALVLIVRCCYERVKRRRQLLANGGHGQSTPISVIVLPNGVPKDGAQREQFILKAILPRPPDAKVMHASMVDATEPVFIIGTVEQTTNESAPPPLPPPRSPSPPTLVSDLSVTSVEEVTECSICFHEIPDDERGYVRCGHVYHNGCIREWLKERDDCPLCRANVFESVQSTPD